MTELISRSAVLEILSNEFDMAAEERAEADNEKDRAFNAGEIHCARRSTRKVKELPAVDAVPVVHARWLLSSTPGMVKVSYDGWIHCPNCAGAFRRIVGTQLFAFCPNCGLRMDAKEDTDGSQDD